MFVQENQSFVELEPKVFDLNDMLVALENCEESAHAEELRHNENIQAETLQHSFQLRKNEDHER